MRGDIPGELQDGGEEGLDELRKDREAQVGQNLAPVAARERAREGQVVHRLVEGRGRIEGAQHERRQRQHADRDADPPGATRVARPASARQTEQTIEIAPGEQVRGHDERDERRGIEAPDEAQPQRDMAGQRQSDRQRDGRPLDARHRQPPNPGQPGRQRRRGDQRHHGQMLQHEPRDVHRHCIRTSLDR